MELTRAVGENIKRIRKSKKLSMERLAAEAGVSRSMLGQIERGEANPSVGLLGKLAGALKVPAEVLLENDDFEPLLLLRELDNKAARLDGGKALCWGFLSRLGGAETVLSRTVSSLALPKNWMQKTQEYQ